MTTEGRFEIADDHDGTPFIRYTPMTDSEGRDAREVINAALWNGGRQARWSTAARDVEAAIFAAAGVEGPGTVALVRGEDGRTEIAAGPVVVAAGLDAPAGSASLPDTPQGEPVITCDPRYQFGRPCVPGTRVPAESVAGCVYGGDAVDEVADDYGISRTEVLWCCAWWVDRGALKPHRDGRRKQWAAWSEHAYRVLGGWDTDAVLCDPDDYQIGDSGDDDATSATAGQAPSARLVDGEP